MRNIWLQVVDSVLRPARPDSERCLLERKQQEEAAKYSANRKALIGSGGREEKIRTYNYPQNRITDHRVNLTLYNLTNYMEGDIAEMVTTLQSSEMAARLEEAGLQA